MHVQDATRHRTLLRVVLRRPREPVWRQIFKAKVKESEPMPELDRRSILGAMLGGIAIAGSGSLLVATTTYAAPLPGVSPTPSAPGSVEKAQVVVVGPRRRRRRRRCWWSRGRRVCGWRW